MKRTLPIILSLLAVSACSDKSAPAESAINGHWLYNPGQCELKLKAEGLFDLKIKESKVYLGDSPKPLPGTWKNHEDDADIKSKAKEWLEDCPTATFSAQQIDDANTYSYSSKVQNVYYIQLPNQWLMIDEEEVYWLLPFNDVKSMQLPKEYPEDIKQGGLQPENS